MKSNLKFTDGKKYFFAFSAAGLILLGTLFLYRNQNPPQNPAATQIRFAEPEKVIYTPFDPNLLDQNQWMEKGFSERQAATILKYKDLLGGEFTSKAQLKKCYAISPEKYEEIQGYILLPETSTFRKNFYSGSSGGFPKNGLKKLKISGKFNPDHYSAEDFAAMGFSEKQAAAIVKYRNYLGGSFMSKEKFSECFVISEENFRQMEPFLLLPEKSPEKAESFYFPKKPAERKPVQYRVFDPNTTDLEGWKSLGFSEKQAQVILNYRDRNLKGSFRSLEDLERCFVISEEKFAEMKPFILLNSETMKPESSERAPKIFAENQKKTVENAARTDFSKIDLNQITYRQLQEFGFDDRSAGMLVGFRKKLGGFVSTQQILETYDIDKELAQKLIATAKLDLSKVDKYTLVDAPAEWLQNHPYFKYSADKIIYYRISNPDEKKIWKFLKLKPEYEARMRLYLKN